MFATRRPKNATPVADGRADETPPTRAKLRKSLYRQRVTAVIGEKATIDKRAEYFGMHRATMARIEKGEIDPRLARAIHMARRLGLTVEDLWSTDEAA